MNRQGQEPATTNNRLKPMILRASQLTALVMTLTFATVGFEPAPKGVYIQIDDTVVYQDTTEKNVADVLAASNLEVESGSIIEPGEQEVVQDGMYITISTPKTITLQVGETITEVETTALTVEELIAEQQIDPTQSILQNLSPQDYIKEDTTIVFNETTIVQESTEETQGYIVEYTTDANLYEDEETVVQAGIDTHISKTFDVTYINGVETSRSLIEETITQAGQPEIIATGTKVRPVEPTPAPAVEATAVAEVSVAAAAAAPVATTVQSTQQQLTLEMSGYSIEGTCGTGACITASGYNIGTSPYYNHPVYGQIRIVATDPSVVPMGSIIEIAGFGKAIALDTGGYIIGNRLDLLFATDAEAIAWGRANISVTVIE
ncbi:MAG: G5 domain-containing protein [Culicoidibacterales bacterium]